MLTALDLSKSYDGAPLFDGLSLTLGAGERAGLVGPNGAGKSTLLRLLAGAERADRGAAPPRGPHRPPPARGRIAPPPREAPAGAATLDSVLADALGEAGATLAELRALEAAEHLDLDRYAPAPERAAPTRAGGAEPRAEEARRRLGIEHLDGDRRLDRLSGGEQARALLAATLLGQPGVLLLDEPTNHLDADGLAWLEGFLAGFDGALLVVSHDRRFLDAVVERVYELAPGGTIEAYDGGYTDSGAERTRRRARLAERAEAQARRRGRLEADIATTRDHA